MAETAAIVETGVGAEGESTVPPKLKPVSHCHTIGRAPSRKSGRSTARWSRHQEVAS